MVDSNISSICLWNFWVDVLETCVRSQMDYLIERYFSLLKILYVNQYTGAAPLVRQLFLQLSALIHIHNRGIVHRDIKPDNIMLSIRDADRFFLIDYGIARPYRTGTPNRYNPIEDGRHVVGTLTWASLNAHGGYGKRLFQLQRLGRSLIGCQIYLVGTI